MKRALRIGAALVAVGLAAAAATVGPELLTGYRFMQALDRYYTGYEADGGPWPQVQDNCALCHGVGGQPSNGQYAALAGQPAAYIQAQLHAFAAGRRHSPQMQPLAANLDDAQIQSLAEYFTRQRPVITEPPKRDEPLARQGQATITARGCSACHGQDLSGSPLGPRIAGQGEAYLRDQLKAFRHGTRQDPTQAMNAMASLLSERDIQATAHYLASLPPAGR